MGLLHLKGKGNPEITGEKSELRGKEVSIQRVFPRWGKTGSPFFSSPLLFNPRELITVTIKGLGWSQVHFNGLKEKKEGEKLGYFFLKVFTSHTPLSGRKEGRNNV